MLFFVLGLPGCLSTWCDRAAVELTRRTLGPTTLVAAETLEELTRNLLRTDTGHAIVSTRAPGGRLRTALIASGRPFALAGNDPRQALIDLVTTQGMAPIDAVRAVASGCAALAACTAAAGALLVEAADDWPPRESTAGALARRMGIGIDATTLAAIGRDVAADNPPRPRLDAAAWWNGLTPLEQATALGALGPFVNAPEVGEAFAITWTGALFAVCGRPGERAAGPVDITGRPHPLIEGPGIMLPRGHWRMTLRTQVWRAAAEHEFAVEVFAASPLAAGKLQPRGEGRTELVLELALDDDALERPVTLRLSSLRAAFDGAIELESVTLVRETPPAS